MARSELFVRKQSGGMFSVVNQALTTGNIFFVNSAPAPMPPATVRIPMRRSRPRLRADQGHRQPGRPHLRDAGPQVIGLGAGSARPNITLGTANTATVAVSADNVSFENMIFTANFLSIAACFTLSTAKNFALRNCYFGETSNVLNFLNIVKSTGAANAVDGLTVADCKWNGLGTTSVNALILSANDIDTLTVLRNVVKLARTADAAMIVITAGVLTNADIGENKFYSAQTATSNGSLINVGGTTSTGFVYSNRVQTLTTTADKLFTTTVGLAAFENRVTGAVGATGFVIPAVDS
jgi:hypothetical protein